MKVWQFFDRHVLHPLYKRLTAHIPVPDPWEQLSLRVPLKYYSSSLTEDFPAYLGGESGIAVTSVDDICDWLAGCTYQSDFEQFNKERWQHLREFESSRVGDCDDYALWAWYKLIELGFDAQLVVGKLLPVADHRIAHVWAMYNDGIEVRLLDGTAEREQMIRSLSEAKTEYRPELGVDRTGRRLTYSGALLSMKELHGIPKHPSDPPTG